MAQTNVAGANGHGKFSINTAGVWTHTMDTAHNEFVAGQDYSDSITVATADGTQQVLTVTMHGTDDATVITGTASVGAHRDQRGAADGRDADGDRSDSSNAFPWRRPTWRGERPRASLPASTRPGQWTHTMGRPTNEFVAGQDYSDSITVATADGTQSRCRRRRCTAPTMDGDHGNGSSAELTETKRGAVDGGTLTATDPDSSNAFVAHQRGGANGYGSPASTSRSHRWTAHQHGRGTGPTLMVTMHRPDDE